MTDEQTLSALRTAFHAEASNHHVDAGAATTAWSAAHDRPRRRRLYAAVAATVVSVAGASTAVAITQNAGQGRPSPGRSPAASACTSNVSTGVLPTWARNSYTSSGLGAAKHIVGSRNRIVAVPFVELRVRQPRGTHNKILWVARHGTGAGPLHVNARLEGTTDNITRTVPLGPSYVDMPAAGCWLLTVQWSGQRDTLALHYVP